MEMLFDNPTFGVTPNRESTIANHTLYLPCATTEDNLNELEQTNKIEETREQLFKHAWLGIELEFQQIQESALPITPRASCSGK